jgi:prevent-host-death family protein
MYVVMYVPNSAKEGQSMTTVGIRDLARNASKIVGEVERTGKATVVTRRGRPTVAVVRIDQGELEDLILATAPEFVEAMREGEKEYREGETVPLDEAFARIDAEEAKENAKKPKRRRR